MNTKIRKKKAIMKKNINRKKSGNPFHISVSAGWAGLKNTPKTNTKPKRKTTKKQTPKPEKNSQKKPQNNPKNPEQPKTLKPQKTAPNCPKTHQKAPLNR